MSGQAGAPRARYFSKEPKENLLIRFSTAARKYWFIYLLAIPGLLFLLVFSYAPMYGVVLAFKDFKMNPVSYTHLAPPPTRRACQARTPERSRRSAPAPV